MIKESALPLGIRSYYRVCGFAITYIPYDQLPGPTTIILTVNTSNDTPNSNNCKILHSY
jgi:hypothetical protein